MKVLLLSSYSPADITNGFGLIVNHTLRHAPLGGVDLAYFRVADPESSDTANTRFRVDAPALTRVSIATGMFGPRSDETSQLRTALKKVESGYDSILWLGLPLDPISCVLPTLTSVPVDFHPNDSVTLHQARRARGVAGRLRSRLSRRRERNILSAGYRQVIYVSREDVACAATLMRKDSRTRLRFLPIGVDVDSWRRQSHAARSLEEPIVLFAGVMSYGPNVDAALFLLRDIVPHLTDRIRIRIVGKNPPQRIIEAARKHSRVTVTGEVDDMRPEYWHATVFVAPMVGTAGIKIKILQALAAGLPVVGTAEARDGFANPPPGLLTAHTGHEIAEQLNALCANPEHAEAIGAQGRAFVEAGWSWQARTERLFGLLDADGS